MNDLRLALLMIGALILVVIYFYSRWENRRKDIREQERGRRRMPTLGTYDESLETPMEPAGGSQETSQKAMFNQSPQIPEKNQNLREQEEELLGNLENFDEPATLVEEAKETHSKKESECNEVIPPKDTKKSRFAFPKKWLKAKPRPEKLSPQPTGPELVIVLTVMARGKSMFRGKDIVRVLEDKGLRYGEMNIYHAYSPGGRAIFSVANIMEPGSFNLEQIERFSTTGLALFMRLPGAAGGFAAFDAMLEIARLLAEKLNGEVRDERRNILTAQALEQVRERILAFNRASRSLGAQGK
ncbi:cell division protein ZipA [Nitrosococcus oceani ATCC 19707]|uniref:Cell division protein ZipA n=2 Tax=Nitrosococcus oceani TaxID=1229 RepID=Q3JAI0_NITOC|nr:cell division protein ZipA [Nitrosococcus oceani]ABA58166.1 cell division protein ZipA [Nitrosococcus oceani ATCC 19707]EDZ66975.1 cell division protein ZipA [Nitrosococcus oceani AFC27]KFI19380.1 cell division protein ZipA [Nitrosococcus oceani C-27]GEM20386.1 cell division protein ZipA [Nitrosococcus oceani]